MRFQNCIFDLYGTLVDIRTDEDAPELWTAMTDCYARLGASYSPAGLRLAFRRGVAEAEREAVRRGVPGGWPEIRYETVFRRLFREKGVDVSLEQAAQVGMRFRKLSRVDIRLYDGAVKLLKTLREKGCGVWLLSNAQRIFTAGELDSLGLTPLFDGICLSSDYGVKKPDWRFFHALLYRQRILPETAVMTGDDSLCDIQGAKAAGLSAVCVHSDSLPEGASFAAKDLREALEFLAGE